MLDSSESQIQYQEQRLYNSKLSQVLTHFTHTQSKIEQHKHNTKLIDVQKQNTQSQQMTQQDNDENATSVASIEQQTEQHEECQQDVEFYQVPKSQLNRKKYGNMIILCQSKHFLLSLGPNYIFFIVAYLCFTLATIYLVGLANSTLQNTKFKIFNFLFCWLQNLSYLLVALANPGVQLPEPSLILDQNEIKNKRFCTKCAAIQQRKTYHCRQCDVCVRDYDHHCPWTSKCIGEGNLKRFYLFVCMTPFYIFYYMVVFMICMANSAIAHDKKLRPHTFMI